MSPDATKKILVLFFDRLPTRWISGYGSDWLETPEFDKMMAEGLTFDDYFSANIDPNDDSWIDPLLEKLEGNDIPLEQEFLPLSHLAATLEASEDDEPTEEEALVADTLEEIVGFFSEEEAGVYWLEIQTNLSERLAQQLPDDREPASSAIAELMKQADFLVGMIRETLKQRELEDKVSIILTSGEGCPLPHQKAGTLHSAATHLPLIVLHPNAAIGERREAICTEIDLADFLVNGNSSEQEPLGLTPLFQSDLAQLHEYLIQKSADAIALRTPAWLFIEQAERNLLFKKPEDRFEVNDLSNKQQEWCESARKFLQLVKNSLTPLPLPEPLKT
ncbi:hypothetical protein KIH39_10560 [Telmatocola sphagniphila]|uniref:Sulfatase N-terminal domain-containing protein n=1 Tax=Telmatocola sphagniphila TaxID=1123043 RepID=A0A8E6B9Q0_9BACT|nr:hypothetical protein [Telmatocola sphagniphila]QVL34321.1 hypothetical protein KIH39_10560 [Telmatocola sphagniphila]